MSEEIAAETRAKAVVDALGLLYYDGLDPDEFVAAGDPGMVRETLLGIDGVGRKTADYVLLFSGGRGGVFPSTRTSAGLSAGWGWPPPTPTTRRSGRTSNGTCPTRSVASATQQ